MRVAALLQSQDSGQQGLALKRAGDCLEEACKRVKAAPELSQHSSYDSITSEDFALGGVLATFLVAAFCPVRGCPHAGTWVEAADASSLALQETSHVWNTVLLAMQAPWACGGRALLTWTPPPTAAHEV